MATSLVQGLPPFDPDTDVGASVGPRWKTWLADFETCVTANDITDDKRKRALLLYQAGSRVREIFRQLQDTGEDKDYKKAVDKLNEYFEPQKNRLYEVYKFRQAKQEEGETLDQFHTRLRSLSQTCEFADASLDFEIMIQIVIGGRSSRLRKQALRDPKITLIEWDTILSPLSNDPNSMAATFQEIFESILNIHAPLRKKRIRPDSAPWLTPEIRKLMKVRDQAKKDAINSPDLWQAYKTLRYKVTKAIRDALQLYYLGIIDENRENPKRMWKAVNKVLNRDTNSVGVSSLDIEGRTLTKEKDIAEALNQRFVTVGPKLAEKLESRNDDDLLIKINAQTENLKFKLIDNTYVLNAISKLKNGKSPGPDKISTRLVKDSGDFIWKPLIMVYNSSLETGVFPDFWKLASVSPIFKAGPRNDVNNYRPISVIAIFSRILEKIVHDQMFEFLQPIFTKNQAAFRKLYSTITSLINSTDSWYCTMDRKEVNLAIFLDLKKAFDTVDYTILLAKLEKYGIRGITGDWFSSYLRNRKQFCTVDGHKSSAKMVTCGIPQGSCLGPLLFIIDLNDLETCLELSKASMYADDTHVPITSNNLENLLENAQRELLNLSEWMRINKLTANPKKTEYMLIGHPVKLTNWMSPNR